MRADRPSASQSSWNNNSIELIPKSEMWLSLQPGEDKIKKLFDRNSQNSIDIHYIADSMTD